MKCFVATRGLPYCEDSIPKDEPVWSLNAHVRRGLRALPGKPRELLRFEGIALSAIKVGPPDILEPDEVFTPSQTVLVIHRA